MVQVILEVSPGAFLLINIKKMQKNFARKTLITKRRELTKNQYEKYCRQISSFAINYLEKEKSSVAIYLAKDKEFEVSTKGIIDFCQKNEYPLAAPKITKNEKLLKFCAYEDEKLDLHPKYNIYEPNNNCKERTLADISVIFVPCVGFSNSLDRIGYGGGFFDKTLHAYKQINSNATTIGLAFSFQEVFDVEFATFDHKLDMIITEEKIYVK